MCLQQGRYAELLATSQQQTSLRHDRYEHRIHSSSFRERVYGKEMVERRWDGVPVGSEVSTRGKKVH
jgi:hypothetical protein